MLTRAVFPYIFFMGSAALGMAALNTKRRFAVASFAPGWLNVALIAAAFLLPGMLRAQGYDPVLALAIGALVGGALQVLAQWPSLRALGFAARPRFEWDDDVRSVFRRIAPLTFGMGVYAIDLVISRRLLSGMGVGAQSYFSWALRICDFPQGIFVMALSTAALPSFSTLEAKGARGELALTWAQSINLAMFIAVPASAALVVLGEPIVAALFQRGVFDARATHETARALFWQGSAVWTVAVVRQTIPALYALGDTRTPVVVSAIDLVAFIALALGLRSTLGHPAVSAAVAGSSTVQMALLLVGLRLRLGTLCGATLARSALRTVAAASIASGAGWTAARLVSAAHSAGPLGHGAPGVAAVAVFGVAYALSAWAMRAPELDQIVSTIRRRLGRGAGS
jgi:putative peptidoglycan lipid II flippase